MITREESPYQDLSHEELVERVHELERRVDDLERALKMFRKQIQRKF